MIDVVNDNDEVVGRYSLDEAKKNKLSYRLVVIFLFNSKNELFIQKRSLNKKNFPGFFDASASGHVDSGETYDSAAKRELFEELGVDTEVKFIGKIKTKYNDITKFVGVYKAVSDADIVLNKEVESGKYYTVDDVKIMLNKEPFLPVVNDTFALLLRSI